MCFYSKDYCILFNNSFQLHHPASNETFRFSTLFISTPKLNSRRRVMRLL